MEQTSNTNENKELQQKEGLDKVSIMDKYLNIDIAHKSNTDDKVNEMFFDCDTENAAQDNGLEDMDIEEFHFDVKMEVRDRENRVQEESDNVEEIPDSLPGNVPDERIAQINTPKTPEPETEQPKLETLKEEQLYLSEDELHTSLPHDRQEEAVENTIEEQKMPKPIQESTPAKDNIILKELLLSYKDPPWIREMKCTRCDFKCNNKKVLFNHTLSEHENNSRDTISNEQSMSEAETEENSSIAISEDESVGFHKCVRCDFKYNTKKEIFHHNLSVHSDERLFKCNYCEKTWFRESHLRRHIATAHKNRIKRKMYQCDECEVVYTRPDSLRRHIAATHTVKYTCKEALKKFCPRVIKIVLRKCDSLVKRSSATTSKPKPFIGIMRVRKSAPDANLFKCGECSYRFTEKSSLEAHMTIAHASTTPIPIEVGKIREVAIKRISAPVLAQKFRDVAVKRITAPIMPEIFPEVPVKRVSTPVVVEKSRQVAVKRVFAPVFDQKVKEDFSCRICDFTTSTHDRLKRHKLSHYAVDRQRNVSGQFEKTVMYFCDQCDYKTNIGRKFSAHVKIHDPENFKNKAHKCSLCQFSSDSKNEIARHKIIHDENKNYMCNKCDSRYHHIRHLNRHKTTAHGITMKYSVPKKAITCIPCGRKFTSKSDLIEHKKSEHKTEVVTQKILAPAPKKVLVSKLIQKKTIKCTRCSFKCNRRMDLFKHGLAAHASERNYKCDQCNFAYFRKDHLKVHLIRAHNYTENFSKSSQSVEKTQPAVPKPISASPSDDEWRSMPDNEFRCQLCEKSYKYRHNLRKHMKSFHSSEFWRNESANVKQSYNCKKCDRVYMYKHNLKRHYVEVHKTLFPGDNFKCDICSRSFEFKANYYRHKKICGLGKTPAEPKISEGAENVIVKIENYPNETEQAPAQTEPLEGVYIKQEPELDVSEITTPTRKPPQTPVIDKYADRFSCDRCNFKTYLESLLEIHKWIHDEEAASTSVSKPTYTTQKTECDSETLTTFTCTQCIFSTEYRTTINMHLLEHSRSTVSAKNKMYNCEKCEYYTINYKLFAQHKFKHLGIYSCQACDFITNNSRGIHEHRLIHGPLLYICHLCDFTSTIRSILESHKREKHVLKCDRCDYRSRNKTLLEKHMKAHDTGELTDVIESTWISNEVIDSPNPSSPLPENPPAAEDDLLEEIVEVDSPPFIEVDDSDEPPLIEDPPTVHNQPEIDDMDMEYFSPVFGCDQCEYETTTEQDLESHKMTHETKMLTCNKCSFKTKHGDNLARHILIHIMNRK